MRTRTTLAALTLAASLAAAGTALASSGPPSDSETGTARHAARCECGHRLLDRLEARAERLAARIVRLEQLLQSGNLTDEQEARAEKVLAHMKTHQTRLGVRIDRLGDRLDEKCGNA
jgi:hypothetical protein